MQIPVPADQQKARTLTDAQAKEIATIMMNLEKATGHPQDFEYAIEEGQLRVLGSYYSVVALVVALCLLWRIAARHVVLAVIPPLHVVAFLQVNCTVFKSGPLSHCPL